MKQILSWNEEYLDLRVAESLEEDGQPAKDRFRSYVKERAKALLDASDEEIEQMLENETDCLHYNDDTDEPAASILYNDYTEFLKMVDVPASYRIRAKYGSVWDGETTIESSCLIDLITREIIEVSVDDREIEGPYSEGEVGDAVECLDVQYVWCINKEEKLWTYTLTHRWKITSNWQRQTGSRSRDCADTG